MIFFRIMDFQDGIIKGYGFIFIVVLCFVSYTFFYLVGVVLFWVRFSMNKMINQNTYLRK